jgi:hypothetical protein
MVTPISTAHASSASRQRLAEDTRPWEQAAVCARAARRTEPRKHLTTHRAHNAVGGKVGGTGAPGRHPVHSRELSAAPKSHTAASRRLGDHRSTQRAHPPPASLRRRLIVRGPILGAHADLHRPNEGSRALGIGAGRPRPGARTLQRSCCSVDRSASVTRTDYRWSPSFGVALPLTQCGRPTQKIRASIAPESPERARVQLLVHRVQHFTGTCFRANRVWHSRPARRRPTVPAVS